MSCVKPLEAFRDKFGAIVFDRVKSLSKVPFKLPCGRCIGCKMERARQWGIRCLHEKKMSSSSCFLTLTYNDECLPDGGTVVKRDLQLFCKRLHNRLLRSRGVGIRYFAGAEYGDGNARPHYHLLIFGYDFPDRRFHQKNMRGENLYTSDECLELWPFGFNTLGEVTFESAIYCAKYALKKVNGAQRESGHYVVYDSDGVLYEREPEFALMSRRPGIGAGYYERFGNEVRDHDSIVIDGREVRPPMFYDKRTEAIDEGLMLRHKRKRKRMAVLNKADNTPARLAVKEELMIRAAEKKERKL